MEIKANGEVPYVWLSEEEWAHLQFTVRSQITGILNNLRMYGQSDIVDTDIILIMEVFDKASQRVRGKDIPIDVISKPLPSIIDEDYS
jgi:hypothetical protein